MFRDNDTRVAGVCGDIWNLLAEQLNFTYVPDANANLLDRKLREDDYVGGAKYGSSSFDLSFVTLFFFASGFKDTWL